MTTILFLFLLYSLPILTAAQGNEDCIETYQDLKKSLRNSDTDNELNLLNAFYPSNESQVHYVKVVYNYSILIDDSTISSTALTLYWTDNAFLANIDYDLLKALTFGIADLTDEYVSLNLSSFCNGIDVAHLLETLTMWLKSYATSDDEAHKGYTVHIRPGISVEEIIMAVFLSITTLTVIVIIYISVFSEKLARQINTIMDEQFDAIVGIMTFPKQLLDIGRKLTKLDKKDSASLNSIAHSTNKSAAANAGSTNETVAANKPETANAKHNIVLDYIDTAKDSVALNFCMLVSFFVKDMISFVQQWLVSPPSKEWYFLFPLIPAAGTLVINIIIVGISVCVLVCKEKCYNDTYIIFKVRSLLNHILFTTLPVFFVYHGFWIVTVTAAFPARTALSALFFGPLFSCILLYSPVLEYLFKMCIDNSFRDDEIKKSEKQHKLPERCPKWYAEFKKWKKLYVFVHFVIIFIPKLVYIPFWVFLLGALYEYSNTLLDIGNVQDDLLKALVLVGVVVGLTHRLSLICKMKNPKSNDEDSPV